jgi:hypothetical protein
MLVTCFSIKILTDLTAIGNVNRDKEAGHLRFTTFSNSGQPMWSLNWNVSHILCQFSASDMRSLPNQPTHDYYKGLGGYL